MNRITKGQVIERVKKDGRDLRKIFKEFRNDKDIFITAVKENNIAFTGRLMSLKMMKNL